MHLFFRIEHGQWSLLSSEEKIEAKTRLSELVQEIRATAQTQLLIFSMVTPKADLGFMLLTPDLHTANAFEKRLSLGLGPDVLQPVYSLLSMTEECEALSSETAHPAGMVEEPGIESRVGGGGKSPLLSRAGGRRKAAGTLYPQLPNWEVFCFYPVTRRHMPEQNSPDANLEAWVVCAAAQKAVEQSFEGRVLQVLTACTGLDDADQGVTLFAHDTFELREFSERIRFDAGGLRYAEAGECYIGLNLPLDELFRRVLF